MTLITRKYIDDHDIVARYLANKLSDGERESFEAYYLEHPELIHELNRTAHFKSGLMALSESGELERLLKPQRWWQRPARLAVAASLVLAIVGISIWFNWQSRSQPILASSITAFTHQFQSTPPVAASFSIQRTRTSSYDATIDLPARTAIIELRIKPDAPAVLPLYRVDLARISADNLLANIAEVNALQPAKDGFVTIYLNTNTLSPSIYEIKLTNVGSNNPANAESTFLIEVPAANNR